MSKLLTIKETAKLLGITESTLKGMIRRGAIPYIKLSPRVLRFDPEELDEYLDQRRVKPRRK